MKELNFVKNIDSLGRIVIPMDIRRQLQINTGDVLSITCNGTEIMLKKHFSLRENATILKIVSSFAEKLNIKVILMDKEEVLFSNIVNIKSKLSNEVKLLIKNGSNLKYINNALNFGDKKVTGIYNMLPIVTNEGIIGSIIVFGEDNTKSYEICELLSNLIMLNLNIS